MANIHAAREIELSREALRLARLAGSAPLGADDDPVMLAWGRAIKALEEWHTEARKRGGQ